MLARFEKKMMDLHAKPMEFSIGDTVAVGIKIVDGAQSRIQKFTGTCIAKRNRGLRSSFTLRSVTSGFAVEKTFLVHLASAIGHLDSIEVKKRGIVRRAKLYYLRNRVGKSAKIREDITAR